MVLIKKTTVLLTPRNYTVSRSHVFPATFKYESIVGIYYRQLAMNTLKVNSKNLIIYKRLLLYLLLLQRERSVECYSKTNLVRSSAQIGLTEAVENMQNSLVQFYIAYYACAVFSLY